MALHLRRRQWGGVRWQWDRRGFVGGQGDEREPSEEENADSGAVGIDNGRGEGAAVTRCGGRRRNAQERLKLAKWKDGAMEYLKTNV